MEEGSLAKWHVMVGDAVKSGDVIAEIETDKATMEVEAVDEGVVEALLVPEGTEEVKVNTPIARLKGEGADALPAPLRGGAGGGGLSEPAETAPEKTPEPVQAKAQPVPASPPPPAPAPQGGGGVDSGIPAGAKLVIEPGRSLVAGSCATLYRVTTVKHTGRTFVAVDGGMADNLDVSLTGQPFEAVLATRMAEPADEVVDLVGRQCESGDRLVAGLRIPAPAVGDLVAMPVTGAYTYTLANNYNGALKPPIVFCRDGRAALVAERETHEHVLALHRPALDLTW